MRFGATSTAPSSPTGCDDGKVAHPRLLRGSSSRRAPRQALSFYGRARRSVYAACFSIERRTRSSKRAPARRRWGPLGPRFSGQIRQSAIHPPVRRLATRIFELRGFFMRKHSRKEQMAVDEACRWRLRSVLRVATSRTIVEPSAEPGSFQIRFEPAHMVENADDRLNDPGSERSSGGLRTPGIPERVAAG